MKTRVVVDQVLGPGLTGGNVMDACDPVELCGLTLGPFTPISPGRPIGPGAPYLEMDSERDLSIKAHFKCQLIHSSI